MSNDYEDLRRDIFRETGARSLTETDIALLGILKELRKMNDILKKKGVISGDDL